MSWSRQFLDALAQPPYSWAYVLRTIGVSDSPGTSYSAATLPNLGDPIIGSNVRIGGSTLTPGTWASTLGAFSVDLAGDLSRLKRAWTRGTFVELLIGRPEWPLSDYQRLAVGQVQQLAARAPNLATLTCRDLLSALRSRPTVQASLLALGYRISGVTTTVTVDYAPGAATLTLASVTGFNVGTGGSAVLITPTSGTAFYLTYTAVVGLTLTGVSSAGVHGTTAVGAAATSVIQPVVYCNGHPLEVLRRFLLSVQGAAIHGYDTLAAGDGLALPYDFVDHMDTSSNYLLSTPTMSFQVVATEAQDNPLGWITSWLAAGGFFVTIRQGLLTGRAAQPSILATIRDAADITDDDIETIQWEAWDSDASSEAANVTITSNNTSTTSFGLENQATLPAYYRQDYDVSQLLFADEAAGRQGIIDRVYESHVRIPERYTITCIGLRHAALAPGDFVRITSRLSSTRHGVIYRYHNGDAYTVDAGLDNTRAIIVQVSADYGRGRVSLVARVYPVSSAQFP